MEMLWGLPPSILLLGATLLVLQLCRTIWAKRKRLPLPPGPSPLPLVGNLFDIPKTTPWVGYRDLSKKYGDLVCLQALGQTVIVVGGAQAAMDLLEKRSVNYADRPVLKLVHATGWGWSFVFAQYGQWWRDRRRVFWQHFRPDAIQKYREHQQDGVRRFLSGLTRSPDKLSEHLRYALTAIVLGSIYGMDVTEDDPNIAIFEKGLESVEFLIANSTWLEYFPALQRLPTWLPGTAVLRRIAEIREAASSIRNTPWNYCKDALQTGNGRDCIAYSMMERISHTEDEVTAAQEDVAKDAAGVAYSGQRERFFVAMSLYPDVQKLAQAELDGVVGRSRMPEPEDRDRLPYVDALVKETLRWYPAVPMGVARRAMESDEYGGYLIPGGATVMVNACLMLNTSICPGRYFADTTMFLLIASVLHLFDISPRLDDHGRPILTEARPVTGVISHLEDWWHCTVKPRSSQTEKLVRDMI
ncbi:cytochrome P450 [Lentinus tigrinus ALCF2SS1-6]|uniref:Cytochrome P450 n=1 Tax=Lentinus tigrinus ALCF2SS1-6 TaxID=1328759 RepID=A0A5C2SGB7_9APHY|nr:cytochrome P450 [Lentinus tigrinus ALCF2SS1-6]